VDRGLVLMSTAADDYNAIDPNLVLDTRGRAWLAFGSFWSGIKLRRLDNRTGLVSHRDTKLCSLATRRKPQDAAPAKPGPPPDREAIEAPFIVRHCGYYYLFVSWDLCCRGIRSTYHIIVGRSKRIAGPYVDQHGVPMTESGAMELLAGNRRWLGPGGWSILMSSNGLDVMVFRAYDSRSGAPALQLSTLTWQGGWPHAALEQSIHGR